MHVITRRMLVEFRCQHPNAEAPLTAWYRVMKSAEFKEFSELRRVFGSADHVDGLTVFDIGGSKYRLIASIHYGRRKVYLREILTHDAYDRGK